MYCSPKKTRDWVGAEGDLEISQLKRFVLVYKSAQVVRAILKFVELKVGWRFGVSHSVIEFNGLLRLLIYIRYEKLKNH